MQFTRSIGMPEQEEYCAATTRARELELRIQQLLAQLKGCQTQIQADAAAHEAQLRRARASATQREVSCLCHCIALLTNCGASLSGNPSKFAAVTRSVLVLHLFELPSDTVGCKM